MENIFVFNIIEEYCNFHKTTIGRDNVRLNTFNFSEPALDWSELCFWWHSWRRWLQCNILICMQKHSQYNKDERTQFFRKNIPLTLSSKMVTNGLWKVMCERWVGDWTKIATYWPPALPAITAFLSRFSGLLNRGPGAQLLLRAGSHSSNCNNCLKTLISN